MYALNDECELRENVCRRRRNVEIVKDESRASQRIKAAVKITADGVSGRLSVGSIRLGSAQEVCICGSKVLELLQRSVELCSKIHD